MKKKAGIILVALMVVCSAWGKTLNSASYISEYSDKLIAQNTEHEAQNTKQETQQDSLHSTLDNLYKQSGEKLITLEMADKMLKDARGISLNDLNDEQGDKLMKIYRTIADAYAANFRFKPAYLVSDEYISLKDTFLERKKTQRLEKIDIETKQLKDDNILKISANEGEIGSLQNENESLSTAKQNVYRTIWIVVLIVAFFSGALIWVITHRYNKAKQHLDDNRKRMMAVAFTSSVGEFSQGNDKGNGNSYLIGIEQLKGNLSTFSDKLPSQNKVSKEMASLLLQLKETIAKL